MNAPGRALSILIAVCGGCGSSSDDAPVGPPVVTDPAASTPPSSPTTTTAPPAPTCPTEPSTDPLTVATTRGSIRGTRANGGVAFLGVPFAAPPIGDLRWKPSVDHACWTGVRDATQYGAQCIQRDVATGAVTGDEDCLFLNVWTPKVDPTKKLPVLFWVHGGANVLGSANQRLSAVSSNLYDGVGISKREDAIVVSINYRLGALGFLAHPSLKAESANQASGNYAIHDQLAGLRWVKDNIEKLGGDPNRVMLFGESAGAMNTCVLLASPLAKGLFAGALMESGDCSAGLEATALAKGVEFAKSIHCTDMACMRQTAASAVVEATPAFGVTSVSPTTDLRHGLAGSVPFAASIDGYAVPDDPMKRLQTGQHNKVPLVVGTNAQEMALFLVASTTFTCGQYESDISTVFGADATKIEAAYPCVLDGRGAEVAALTDLMMTCPSRRIARASQQAGQPTFVYSFAHTATYGGTVGLGAYHAAELPYVFGTFDAMAYIPTPSESDLSNAMQDHWGAFARTWSPNATGLTHWPSWTTTESNVLEFDDGATSKNDDKSAKCHVWADVMGW